MPDDDTPSHYISYLLRVWRVEGQAEPGLRALVENIATGERVSFSDLSGLITFLERQTAGPARVDVSLLDAMDRPRS